MSVNVLSTIIRQHFPELRLSWVRLTLHRPVTFRRTHRRCRVLYLRRLKLYPKPQPQLYPQRPGQPTQRRSSITFHPRRRCCHCSGCPPGSRRALAAKGRSGKGDHPAENQEGDNFQVTLLHRFFSSFMVTLSSLTSRLQHNHANQSNPHPPLRCGWAAGFRARSSTTDKNLYPTNNIIGAGKIDPQRNESSSDRAVSCLFLRLSTDRSTLFHA